MTYTDTPRVERRRGRAPFLFVFAVMSTVLLTACVGGGGDVALDRTMAAAPAAEDASADDDIGISV